MKHQLFISVHVPKTAGTSFRNFLANVFGERLLLDYRSKPLDKNFERRAIANLNADAATFHQIAGLLETADVCVHGHFLPEKYLAIFPSAILISWVREPAQRLMSHYAFWQQNPQPEHSVAQQIVANQLDFEAFCEVELMRDVITRFFGGLSNERFGFIGVTERYDESIRALCRRYNWAQDTDQSTAANRARINPHKPAASYAISTEQATKIEQLNPWDYRLYREVLANFCNCNET